jgi:predicted ArsR family transcriptional regulator
MLRYRETGGLHKDFHGSMNAAVEYVGRRYGREGLREVFRNTAQKVYRSIYEKLKAGDWSELIEHWRYFMDREGADYSLEVTGDAVVMTVRRCPAVARLKELGMTPSEFFCDQTVLLNEAWCENTPFEAVTEITGDGSCVQTIRRSSKVREF